MRHVQNLPFFWLWEAIESCLLTERLEQAKQAERWFIHGGPVTYLVVIHRHVRPPEKPISEQFSRSDGYRCQLWTILFTKKIAVLKKLHKSKKTSTGSEDFLVLSNRQRNVAPKEASFRGGWGEKLRWLTSQRTETTAIKGIREIANEATQCCYNREFQISLRRSVGKRCRKKPTSLSPKDFVSSSTRLPFLTVRHLPFGRKYKLSVEFKVKSWLNFCRSFFTLFCTRRLRNDQSFKRTCRAIVLFITSFVSLRSRRRHCRGFLEVPNNSTKTSFARFF